MHCPAQSHRPRTGVNDSYTPGTPGQVRHRAHGEPGAVIAVTAPKGGSGVTSAAVQLAQHAANTGLRTVLVDMNRGQGGVRVLLRQAARTDLPSVYDHAAGDGNAPEDVIVTPGVLNDGRSRQYDRISFATVLAPPEGLPARSFLLAGAAAYRAVTAAARDLADLVIVDAGVLAQHDTTGLHSHVLVPGLRDDGWWGLLIVPGGDTEAAHLGERRLRQLRDAGAGEARLMYAASLMPAGPQAPAPDFSALAHPAPGFRHDPAVRKALSESRFAETRPSVAAALNGVLHRVTGHPGFDVTPQATDGQAAARGLFGRRPGKAAR